MESCVLVSLKCVLRETTNGEEPVRKHVLSHYADADKCRYLRDRFSADETGKYMVFVHSFGPPG